jgi:hypothetical protein
LNDKTEGFQPGVQPRDPERRPDQQNAASSVASNDRVFVADTIKQCVTQGLKQKTVAKMLGVTVRQIQRMVKDYKSNEYEYLLKRPISSKPVNAIPVETREEIVELCKTTYHDIGPLQTSEYLLDPSWRRWLFSSTPTDESDTM